jgi:hypothetical protein
MMHSSDIGAISRGYSCFFLMLLPISMYASLPLLSLLYAASRAQVTWV